MREAVFFVLLFLFLGCVKEKESIYVCWDSSTVQERSLCPDPTTTATTSTTTTSSKTTSTTTSTTSTTSSTATSTTQSKHVFDGRLPCGNGVLDEGEECDTGYLCSFAEGVCNIRSGWANCMVDGICSTDSQVYAGGKYDMGECTGCYRQGHRFECSCIEGAGKRISSPKTYPCGPMDGGLINTGQGPHLVGDFFIGQRGQLVKYEDYDPEEGRYHGISRSMTVKLTSGSCEDYTLYLEPFWNHRGNPFVLKMYNSRTERFKDKIFNVGTSKYNTDVYRGGCCGYDIYFDNGELYTVSGPLAFQICENTDKMIFYRDDPPDLVEVNTMGCFGLALDYVRITGDNVSVRYSKDFEESARFYNRYGEDAGLNSLNLPKPGRDVEELLPLSDFKGVLSPGKKLRLCRKNDMSRCTKYVTVN